MSKKLFHSFGWAFFVLPFFLIAQNHPDFAKYKALNDAETRLIEYKDSDHNLDLKLFQLDKINQSRAKFKAKPVQLDILASRVANKMCKNAAENKYIGHWDTQGAKPYHRYAFAGGVDHVAENASGKFNSADFPVSDEFTSSSMLELHQTFMAEKAPRDAHKQTIIAPKHNFVGIGFFQTSNQFRYYEEFVDRYYEFIQFPTRLKVNETAELVVKPQPNKFFFELLAFRENPLKPKPVSTLSSLGGYEDYSSEIAINIPPMDMPKYRNGDTYTIPIQFKKSGLYYIHLCETDDENLKPGRYSDAGKLNACGLVILVE